MGKKLPYMSQTTSDCYLEFNEKEHWRQGQLILKELAETVVKLDKCRKEADKKAAEVAKREADEDAKKHRAYQKGGDKAYRETITLKLKRDPKDQEKVEELKKKWYVVNDARQKHEMKTSLMGDMPRHVLKKLPSNSVRDEFQASLPVQGGLTNMRLRYFELWTVMTRLYQIRVDDTMKGAGLVTNLEERTKCYLYDVVRAMKHHGLKAIDETARVWARPDGKGYQVEFQSNLVEGVREQRDECEAAYKEWKRKRDEKKEMEKEAIGDSDIMAAAAEAAKKCLDNLDSEEETDMDVETDDLVEVPDKDVESHVEMPDYKPLHVPQHMPPPSPATPTSTREPASLDSTRPLQQLPMSPPATPPTTKASISPEITDPIRQFPMSPPATPPSTNATVSLDSTRPILPMSPPMSPPLTPNHKKRKSEEADITEGVKRMKLSPPPTPKSEEVEITESMKALSPPLTPTCEKREVDEVEVTEATKKVELSPPLTPNHRKRKYEEVEAAEDVKKKKKRSPPPSTPPSWKKRKNERLRLRRV